MTLKRTAFLRKPPEVDRLTVTLLRSRKCSICFTRFTPARKNVTWCGPECGYLVSQQVLAKNARAEAKRQASAHPTQKQIEALERAAQSAVNRVAVLRDWHDGCISCEKGPHWSGTWHGSHYKSVGSNSALRFNLWNISKSCSECNWHKSGNIASYVPRLEVKFGADRLEWLNDHTRMRAYTPEYLARLGAVMRKKARRMEKRLGLRK